MALGALTLNPFDSLRDVDAFMGFGKEEALLAAAYNVAEGATVFTSAYAMERARAAGKDPTFHGLPYDGVAGAAGVAIGLGLQLFAKESEAAKIAAPALIHVGRGAVSSALARWGTDTAHSHITANAQAAAGK